MKYIKYLFFSLPVLFLLGSCDKHELSYAENESAEEMALFQVSYIAPVTNNAANGLDSIYVNGKLFGGVGGAGQLLPSGAPLPYGVSNYTGHFYTAPVGNNTITLYKADKVVYEKTVNLYKGRQKVFVYSLDKDPIIIDELYPYTVTSGTPNSATFDSDSLATVRFFNFVWQDSSTPYPGKLQYQWSNNSNATYSTGDWHNVGSPVGFGEATEHCLVVVHKDVFNSSGYQTIRFRCLDESGNVVSRSTDYWTFYIGRRYNHFFRGCITGSPSAAYTQSNGWGA